MNRDAYQNIPQKITKIFAEKPQFKKVIYCNYFLPFITHLPF